MTESPSNPEIGKSVRAAGLATNYLEQGQGFPVVLIHGSGPGVTAFANWRLTVPALATSFRVLAPDMAGFGYTERRAEGGYTLDSWVEHIVGFLDALDIKQAHFVGNSFGGGLSLAVAAQHPDRVKKLVLMGSVGTEFELTRGLDQVWGYEPSLENMQALIAVFAYNKSLISDDLVRSRHAASIRPGFHESYAQLFPAPRQRHIKALATDESQVAALPHDVLIVHGRDDQVIPVEHGIKLSRLIKKSELHIFGGCGHWTQIEKKDRFNRLVAEFLAD